MVAVPIMIYLGRSSNNRIKSNIFNNKKKQRIQKEIKNVCNKYKYNYNYIIISSLKLFKI
jgi:uncharacterized phage protein gp47/JayE